MHIVHLYNILVWSLIKNQFILPKLQYYYLLIINIYTTLMIINLCE